MANDYTPTEQNLKNTESAKAKGYDVGKKVSGINSHIVLDTQEGLAHVMVVTLAKAALLAFWGCEAAFKLFKTYWPTVDVGQLFALAVEELLGAKV